MAWCGDYIDFDVKRSAPLGGGRTIHRGSRASVAAAICGHRWLQFDKRAHGRREELALVSEYLVTRVV